MPLLASVFLGGVCAVIGIISFVMLAAAVLDLIEHRQKKRAQLLASGVRVLVKPKQIKDRGLQQRLLAHRSIIAASKDQAEAHREKHDYKVERRTKALMEWDQQFAEAKPALTAGNNTTGRLAYNPVHGGVINQPLIYQQQPVKPTIVASHGDMLELARSLKKQLAEAEADAERLRQKNKKLKAMAEEWKK